MAAAQDAVSSSEKRTSTPENNVGLNEKRGSSASISLEAGVTPAINEKQLLRKLDLYLLPALTLLYLLSFLDRSNVGNARIEGLAEDINMTGNQYLTGLTLYFVGYVIVEVPANIILKRTTPQFWLPTLTLIWGIVSTLSGIVHNYAGFLATRFFLGVAESGLFPGVVFYLSMWYRRNEQHYRIAMFFSAAALAGAFGGILAWSIAKMRGIGGLNGWQWIFILEGILTVVVSIASYFFIYNYPRTAKFITEDERRAIELRLATDTDATRQEPFKWSNVKLALTDIKVYLYCAGFHTMALPLYTLSLFLPSIITSLGYTAAQAQLLTVPPYAFAFLTTLGVSLASEKYHIRAPFIIGSSAFAIIGYIILLTNPATQRPAVSYIGTIFAAGGIYPATAIVLSWPANNVSGQTKRATANALQISIGDLGAVLGTQLYRTETAPRYRLGHGFALGYLVANIAVTSLQWWVLSRENKKREAGIEREKILTKAQTDDGWLGDDEPEWRFQT